MIKSFADTRTQDFYRLGKSKHFPAGIFAAARRKLFQLEYARTLGDLASPPGNHLEALKGDREGQHSVRINNQYRLCFRFVGGDAFDVEIADYH